MGSLKHFGYILAGILAVGLIAFLLLACQPAGEDNRWKQASEMPVVQPAPALGDHIPKNIWIFWNNPSSPKLPPLVDVCVSRVRALHPASQGWKVVLINRMNIQQYVDEADAKLFWEITKASHRSFANATDYLRLYLLKHHGGIWLDSTILPFRSLDWVNEIPNKPELILYQNPQSGTWDHTAIKYPRRVETSFLAAPKGSPFIAEWFAEAHTAFQYYKTYDYLIAQNETTDIRTECDTDYFTTNAACQTALKKRPDWNIAFLDVMVDFFRWKYSAEFKSNIWDCHSGNTHGFARDPAKFLPRGARMVKFISGDRAAFQKDPKLTSLKLLEAFSGSAACKSHCEISDGIPAFLEVTFPSPTAKLRDPVRPWTKWNSKVWSFQTIIYDKRSFVKNWALPLGIAAAVALVILLGLFLWVRFRKSPEDLPEHNPFTFYLTVAQATLVVISMIVGFCNGRTATQGGQIAIMYKFINEDNYSFAFLPPLTVIALVYGFQSDALQAGFYATFHFIGTAWIYSGNSRTTAMFFKAWDTYLMFIIAVVYFVIFAISPTKKTESDEVMLRV